MSLFVLLMPLSSVFAETTEDISDLTSIYEDDTVTLKWVNPIGVGSISLYRNDVLLTMLDKEANYYHDTDISKDKTYSYKVTVDIDGNESNGMVSTIKTVSGSTGNEKVPESDPADLEEIESDPADLEEIESDPADLEENELSFTDDLTEIDYSIIPPANIVSLKSEKVTADSVRLTWDNPVDIDLIQINIYQDGKKIKELPLTSEFTVTKLIPNTDYIFSVSVVDTDDNEGPRMSLPVSTLLGADIVAPATVKGVDVIPSNTTLYVKWLANKEQDLAGYNVYLNGVKRNSTPIKNVFYSVSSLENDDTYNVSVTAVDTTGNESDVVSSYGVPLSEPMPVIGTDYTLKDVSVGVETWFSQYWLIIAFAISVPLTFYIAARTKLLFLD